MEKKIEDTAEKLQDEETKIEEVVGTYMLILANLETDGYFTDDVEINKAALFAYRFKAYIPALQLIGRELTERQEAISSIINGLERDVLKTKRERERAQ